MEVRAESGFEDRRVFLVVLGANKKGWEIAIPVMVKEGKASIEENWVPMLFLSFLKFNPDDWDFDVTDKTGAKIALEFCEKKFGDIDWSDFKL
jgi:hypothetical protein